MRRTRREEEFTEYFSVRAPAMRRTAYLIVRDWHVAEDLTQTSFVRLYAAWPRVEAASRDAYTRKIVVNQCLSHLRRRRETPTDRLPEQVAVESGGVLDLGRVLALLPPRQRAIVALRFLDDLSVVETSRVLDIAEGTVKSQTSRALETLRRHLPDLVTEES
jgi:RNA polymerase sigma-70 factor (sigma-E family)